MTYLVGKCVLDVRAGAPNNGRGDDNVGVVKQMWVGRDVYPYVSAQAFRRWLRDSMPGAELRSPVTRSGTGRKQQAYTAGRPDKYLDDDLFGYMVSEKGNNYQRDTVFATGTFVSVVSRRPARDFGTMSRGFAAGENPVIHEHEHYTAELAGDLMLDLPRVGTFELEGSGLRRTLGAAHVEEAMAAGAQEIRLRDTPCVRFPLRERRRRAAVLLRTLAEVRGGAKKALHYGDRSPSLVLLAPMKGGNNPFSRVLAERDRKTTFAAGVLREEMDAWAEDMDGALLLGWSPGFLGEQRAVAERELADLVSTGRVVIDHPRVLLRGLANAIEAGEHDDWFEDSAK